MEDKFQKIQEQIDEMKRVILANEEGDRNYLGDQIRELRHLTTYVHTVLEEHMELAIGRDIQKKLRVEDVAKEDKQEIMQNILEIFDDVPYAKKASIVKKSKLMPESLIGKLFQVNNIRIYFSHPKTYYIQLQSYRDPEKYLEALRTVHDALDELNDFCRKLSPELYQK